jgi:hypothetical protein
MYNTRVFVPGASASAGKSVARREREMWYLLDAPKENHAFEGDVSVDERIRLEMVDRDRHLGSRWLLEPRN